MTGNVLHADPIKLFGIDWSMSYDEMVTVLEDKGYDCETDEDTIDCLIGEYGTGDEYEIKIFTGEYNFVQFNCKVFNGCQYSIEQIRDLLIEEEIASFFLPKDVGGKIMYKAEGEEGDEISVQHDYSPYWNGDAWQFVPSIYLSKGTLGHKVNFN